MSGDAGGALLLLFPRNTEKNSTAAVLFFSALTETAREIFYVLFIFFPCILYLFLHS